MKIAIIGTNFVSDSFVEATRGFDQIELSVACSLTNEQAKIFADKYEILNYTDNYETIVNVDLAYVAVPNSVHVDVVKHFINNGIPVICEKPFMINEQQVKEILNLAKDKKTFVMENLIPPYSDALRKAKELINEIGTIRSVYFNQSQYSSRYDSYLNGENPITFNPNFANGAVMDLGIYAISWPYTLFGNPISVISKGKLLESGADISGTAILEYEKFNAVIMYGKANSTFNENEISGENGTIVINSSSHPTHVKHYGKDKELISEYEFTEKHRMHNSLRQAIEAIENNNIETLAYGHNDILEMHKLLTDIRYKSNIKFKNLGE